MLNSRWSLLQCKLSDKEVRVRDQSEEKLLPDLQLVFSDKSPPFSSPEVPHRLSMGGTASHRLHRGVFMYPLQLYHGVNSAAVYLPKFQRNLLHHRHRDTTSVIFKDFNDVGAVSVAQLKLTRLSFTSLST